MNDGQLRTLTTEFNSPLVMQFIATCGDECGGEHSLPGWISTMWKGFRVLMIVYFLPYAHP